MGISQIRNKNVFDRISKLQAQNTKKEKMFLENKLKKLENNTNCIENSEYIQTVEINSIKYMNKKLIVRE